METWLTVYNCSNITKVEGIIHRERNVDVEVSDGYMFLFIIDTFHAALK